MIKSLDLGLKVSSGDGRNITDWHLEQFHERYARRVISYEQRGVQERNRDRGLDLGLEASSGDGHNVTDLVLGAVP